MKRVIKNQKKMKNTMYVVFGVFALALFAITRTNPSYASDGLILDDALDAIAGGNITENPLLENNEGEESQPIEGEDLTEPEIILDDELDDKGEESQKINEENIEDSNKGDNNEISQNLEDKDLEGNDNEKQETEITEGNNENNTIQEEIEENVNTEQNGQDNENNIFENKGFKSMDYSLATLEQDSENPYIVYDEENGLITVYTGDFSYGITIQDKNLGANNTTETGNYYKRGTNEILDESTATKDYITNQNARGGGEDNNTSNENIIGGYNTLAHKVTNEELRKGPCPEGYHIPSRGEAQELLLIYRNILNNEGTLNSSSNYMDINVDLLVGWLKIIYGGSYSKEWYGWNNSLGQSSIGREARFWTSSASENNKYANTYAILKSGRISRKTGNEKATYLNIRCFKNDYIRYPKTVSYHPNGGAFSGMEVNETKEYTYNYSGTEIIPIYNIQIPDRESEDITQQSGWMFAGWYTKDGTNNDWGEEFDISNPQSTTAYAKWLPFNDLDLSVIGLPGIKIMDRNMGAKMVAEGILFDQGGGNHENDDALGLYYQRGNNYGFPNTGNSIKKDKDNNIDWESYGPNNYYYSNIFKLFNDSLINNDLNMWGGEFSTNSDVDKKGPCPEGYHVPDTEEWKAAGQYILKIKNNICNDNMSNGECFAYILKIPYAGYRYVGYNNDGEISAKGYAGDYRSSSRYVTSNQSFARDLRLINTPIGLNTYSFGNLRDGHTIRCFKNSQATKNLTFNSDNGEDNVIYNIKWWEPITESYKIIPEKEGYKFIGWYNGDDEFHFSDSTLISENTVLTAKWEKNPWYTYNANGGKFLNKDLVKEIKSIEDVKKVNVTNENHQYEAYINRVNFPGAKYLNIKGKFTPSRTNTLKVYDKYNNQISPNLNWQYYTFEFSVSGDSLILETSSNNEYPMIYYSGDVFAYGIYKINQLNENPSRSGYTFSGRYGLGATKPFDFTGTEVTKDRTFYAKWDPHHYTIQFDINEGTGKISDINATYGEEINLPKVTREGYIFKGWKSEDGTIYNNIVSEGTGVTTEDGVIVTLIAQWEKVQESSGSKSGGSGGSKKSESTPKENTRDTATEEHNSADEEQIIEASETTNSLSREETSNQVISVTQEVSEDGTVEAVVETVKIKNTDIVATVRTEVNPTNSSSSSSSSVTHTKEQKDAYSFAKSNGLTTTESIEEAKMNTELTRIQMAKMLSNFAINVLGQEPDTEKGIVKFSDVTNNMDKQYDNAVTKAYQLGIMGQNVKNNEFRPNDTVTRAEFSTALSRLLYKTDEGKYKGTGKYYKTHITKLYNEGIIIKADPSLKEKRGYVMTMLMRTVK